MALTEKIKIALISGGISVAVALIGGYFSAQHLVSAKTFILSGVVDVSEADALKGGMDKSGMQRQILRHVEFSKEFDNSPSIITSIAAFDIQDGDNMKDLIHKPSVLDDLPSPGIRLRTYTQNVTSKGFDLVIQTWSKTELYGITVSWYALPSEFRNN